MDKKEYEKYCEMQANWWIAAALTGYTKHRKITDGSGRELTDEEKIADAMKTAQNHIQNFWKSCNSF